jgi:hypothetical protein
MPRSDSSAATAWRFAQRRCTTRRLTSGRGRALVAVRFGLLALDLNPHTFVLTWLLRRSATDDYRISIFTSFVLELVVDPAIYEIWKWHFGLKRELATEGVVPGSNGSNNARGGGWFPSIHP